jgi:hypothetical protein
MLRRIYLLRKRSRFLMNGSELDVGLGPTA